MNFSFISFIRIFLLWSCSFCMLQVSELEAQGPSQLVSVEPGNLPIILTAPHGGSEPIPNVPERQGKGVSMFKSTSDTNTDKLAIKLADAIETKLGKRPYVVIAKFHRKFLDANRRARDAFESDEAAAVYAAYHQAIADSRQAVIDRWGHGVLFDIHGQAARPKTIFRGTQNGKTTFHLVARFGEESQRGESSLWGFLSKQGLDVFPPVGSIDSEHRDYDGGYTVITHGSGQGGTVDAIQLELGQELRASKAIPQTAKVLADAIAGFAAKYLPQTEQNDTPSTNHYLVRVGVYVDKGAGPSVNNLISVLRNFEHVSVIKLKAENIKSGGLSNLDLLIHPGGSGGNQGRHLGEDGRDAIRKFVKDGGGFIGVCAGSYLATADYSWSLNILDAKVIDRQHWNRGNGSVEIAITDVGRELLGVEDQRLSIHYAQGPLLAPANRPEIEDYETVATFETEIAKNGAPQGVMKGTTAIAKAKFGNGRVICFSPHPELSKGLEKMVRLAIEYVQRDHE